MEAACAFLTLVELFPCVQEGDMLQPFAATFGLEDAPPAALADMMAPHTKAALLPEICRGNDMIADVLKRNKTLRSASVPHRGQPGSKSEPVALPSANSLPPKRSAVRCACIVPEQRRRSASSGLELLVGYASGAVALWNMDKYVAAIDERRRKCQHAAFGAVEEGLQDALPCHGWTDVLGYHRDGPVNCLTYDGSQDVAFSGSLDGDLLAWDVHGELYHKYALHSRQAGYEMPLYVPLPGDEPEGGFVGSRPSAPRSAEETFAAYARRRRLSGVAVRAHAAPLTTVAMFKEFLLSGGGDGCVHVWQTDTKVMGRVNFTKLQTIRLVGQWNIGLIVSQTSGVQTDDVIATDETGHLTALKLTALHERNFGAAGGGSRLPERDNYPFRVSRQKRVTVTLHVPKDDALLQEQRGVLKNIETSSHSFLLYSVANNSLLVALPFSPVAILLEYSTLDVVGDITHPSLKVDRGGMAGLENHSSQVNETKRRSQLVSWMAGAAQPARDVLDGQHSSASAAAPANGAQGKDRGKGQARETSAPLRFLSAFFDEGKGHLMLLDNYGTAFVWHLSSRSFLAQVDILGSDFTAANAAFTAAEQLPISLLLLWDTTDSGGGRKNSSRMARDDEEADDCAFLVLSGGSMKQFRVATAASSLKEAKRHTDHVIGVAVLTAAVEGDGRPTTASMRGDEGFGIALLPEEITTIVSASRNGELLCWRRDLVPQHTYNLVPTLTTEPFNLGKPPSSVRGRTGRTSLGRAAASPTFAEVSTFSYNEPWGLAITGHDDGDLCYWGCEGELTNLIDREKRHRNTVAAITPSCSTHIGLLATAGFDGVVATWKHPTRHSNDANHRGTVKVSPNELLSICISVMPHAAVRSGRKEDRGNTLQGVSLITGDSAGNVFFLAAETLEPYRVVRTAPLPAFLLSDSDTITQAPTLPPGLSHEAGVVAVCTLERSLVTCDEDGCILRWTALDTHTPQRFYLDREEEARDNNNGSGVGNGYNPTARYPTPGMVRKYPFLITCAAPATAERFFVGTKEGSVFFFDCAKEGSFPLAVYHHSCEVASMGIFPAKARPSDGDNEDCGWGDLGLVLGSIDGVITQLSVMEFSPF